MQKLLIKIIRLYQKTPSIWHSACRFYPTCSAYAIESIETYGSIKGLYLTIKRLLRCTPYGSFGYDPVPKKGEKL